MLGFVEIENYLNSLVGTETDVNANKGTHQKIVNSFLATFRPLSNLSSSFQPKKDFF